MTTNTLHTPLEVLLFFQSLSTIGIDSPSFHKISDLLKQNEFIRESVDYDPDRLSPESLKALCLNLLKDEVKNERQKRASPGRDADRNPKKAEAILSTYSVGR